MYNKNFFTNSQGSVLSNLPNSSRKILRKVKKAMFVLFVWRAYIVLSSWSSKDWPSRWCLAGRMTEKRSCAMGFLQLSSIRLGMISSLKSTPPIEPGGHCSKKLNLSLTSHWFCSKIIAESLFRNYKDHQYPT